MKLKRIFMALAFLALIGNATPIFAQEEASQADTGRILQAIQQEAIANYDIPDDILTNLGMNPGALRRPGVSTPRKGEGAVQKRQGYRIQVFGDGRNPATLQARARARGNAIVARFPKYRGQVYSFSAAPNWYTRIGNFKTADEAANAMAELKRAFPAFAGEMRVVKSQITIIK